MYKAAPHSTVCFSKTRKRLNAHPRDVNTLRLWLTSKYLLLFSRSVMSDPLWPRGLQHIRLPCPSPTPGACSKSCLLSQFPVFQPGFYLHLYWFTWNQCFQVHDEKPCSLLIVHVLRFQFPPKSLREYGDITLLVLFSWTRKLLCLSSEVDMGQILSLQALSRADWFGYKCSSRG